LNSSIANQQLVNMLNQGGRSFSGKERHCIFLNTGNDPRGNGQFANVSAITGLDLPDDGRAIGVVDWDQDGDQDLWLSNRNAPRLRFMRNESPADNNYLALRLVGNGKTTNRDAIGARVEVVLDDSHSKATTELPAVAETLIQSLRAGEGFLAQSSKWVHFGLGDANAIKKVVVHWPNGKVEDFNNLKVNHRYQLVQGSAKATEITPPDRKMQLATSSAKETSAAPSMRIPLVALLRVPDLNYLDFRGNRQSLTTASGGPLLINLWSTSCKPCLEELNDFTKRSEEIRSAGIRIVALSIDGLEKGPDAADASQEVLTKIGFPFDAGEATKELIQILYSLKKSLLFSAQELPLPTSFLLDASGRLAVIYLGPVSVDNLLEDRHHASLTTDERYERSAARVGSMLKNDMTDKIVEKNEALAFYNFAESLREQGLRREADLQFAEAAKLQHSAPNAQKLVAEMLFKWSNLLAADKNWSDAAVAARKAIDKSPGNAKYHYNLGVISKRLGDLQTAQEHYENAIDIDPGLISAHVNLAMILAKKKEWEKAEKHFRRVSRARPRDAEIFYNLGVALAEQDKWQEASNQFRQALKIRPSFSQASNYLDRATQNLKEE
jgi:tetratricopeptide (TPR) repeat protein